MSNNDADMPVLIRLMTGELNTDYPINCRCGMLVYTNNNLTTLYCNNPLCITHTMFNMTSMLGLLGLNTKIGPATAEGILDSTNIATHVDMFGITKAELYNMEPSCSLPVRRAQAMLEQLNASGGIPLTTYIQLWCLPALGATTCNKLFNGENSLNEFYDKYLGELFMAKRYIGSRIGQSPFTETVHGIYKTLITCKEELIRCLKYFVICEVDDREISICITKSITKIRREDGTSFSPRKTLVPWLIKKYHRNFTYYDNFNSKVQFLICDENVNTPKMIAANVPRIDKWALDKQMEDPTYNVGNRIFTSSEFISLIESGNI